MDTKEKKRGRHPTPINRKNPLDTGTARSASGQAPLPGERVRPGTARKTGPDRRHSPSAPGA